MVYVSASFSCSCDGPGSLSSLMGQTDFFAYFFFCTGATDIGMGCCSGLSAVPAAGPGAALVAGEAAEMAGGSRAATVPVDLFSPPSTLEY